MAGKKVYVERYLLVEELDQKIRLKQDVKILKKLLFIKSLYQDESVEKSANLWVLLRIVVIIGLELGIRMVMMV